MVWIERSIRLKFRYTLAETPSENGKKFSIGREKKTKKNTIPCAQSMDDFGSAGDISHCSDVGALVESFYTSFDRYNTHVSRKKSFSNFQYPYVTYSVRNASTRSWIIKSTEVGAPQCFIDAACFRFCGFRRRFVCVDSSFGKFSRNFCRVSFRNCQSTEIDGNVHKKLFFFYVDFHACFYCSW